MKSKLYEPTTGISHTKYVVTVGVFSAVAFMLQLIGSFIGIKVGGFLEVEISDIPPLILSMAYGPLFGVLAELIKNILHCFMSSTGFVGEFANFIITGSLCFISGMIYRHHKTFKMAIVSLLCGTLGMVIVGAFANLYIMLPLYMQSADFATRFNIVMSLIVPFNLAKGVILSIITVILYKKMSRILK